MGFSRHRSGSYSLKAKVPAGSDLGEWTRTGLTLPQVSWDSVAWQGTKFYVCYLAAVLSWREVT